MGLLADWQALGADQTQLATLNGNVTTASQALDAANAAVAAEGTTITAATTQVVTDLTTAPYTGTALVPDPSDTNTPPTSYLLLTVTATTPPGLSAQSVPVAS